eukprot:gene9563-10551_t
MASKIDIYEEKKFLQRSQVDLGRIQKNKSKGARCYTSLLVAGKCLHAFGIFVSYGILKNITLVQFLFLAKAFGTLICILLQRPFTTGKRVSRTQWRMIIFSSACNVIITLLWLDALVNCGPLRAILLYQHCDMVILSSVGILFQKGGLTSKIRGASMFLLGLTFLLFFDRGEEHSPNLHDGEQKNTIIHNNAIMHYLYHLFTRLGLPDHKSGIFFLLLASICRVFYNSYCKNLSVDVGGGKRLNCLMSLTETMLLLPWFISGVFLKGQFIDVSNLLPIFIVTMFVFVVDFYIESIASAKLESHTSSCMGSITSFIAALAIALYWEHVPFTALKPYEMQKHGIAAGAVFAAICFILATRILTRPVPVKPGMNRGMLIGFSKGGLPLYSYAGPGSTIQQAPMTIIKQYLRKILDAPDSRNIFFYLCLNLMFTGVELAYGVWTNSLGLISDGFHMLFDCSALVLGLAASVMSRWKASKGFSFGYGRLEILSGFVNGLFLVVIAFFVFTAALQRLVDPPRVNTDKLLAVSVAGLVVNMIGIFAFSHAHAHSHGGAKCEDSPRDGHFGHSHDGAHHHGHSHDNNHHKTSSKNSKGTTNMQGVFLHVVADTLGSVGVIISSLLIQQYNWYIADPICSLFIAVMIFMSVLPLLKQSSHVLLLKTPHDLKASVRDALIKVMHVPDVLSYKDEHIWRQSADSIVGTVHIQVAPNAIEKRIYQQVMAIFKDHGFGNMTIQIEKETFYHNLNKLSGEQFHSINFPAQRATNISGELNNIKSV